MVKYLRGKIFEVRELEKIEVFLNDAIPIYRYVVPEGFRATVKIEVVEEEK